jgi:protein-disulfide isomerase
MSGKSSSTKNERRARAEQLKAEREAAARASERRTRLLIVVAVIAAIALIAVAVVATQSSTGENAAVPNGVEAPGGGAPFGDDTAPVVMDEWVDFSCPACKTFNDSLGPTINDLVEAGDLQVIYHPVSFINAGSMRAANAFGCAVDQDKTHEFYDAVFAAQGAESEPVTNEALIDIGASIGIDSAEFEACVNDGTYDGWADNLDVAQAEAGVTGTPTIFLNGQLTELPSFEPQALLDAIAAVPAAE